MGIPGLYAELGPGKRISLAKYASDHHVRTGRRLRIAVDASIWSFQVQSGKGGSNPALRTVYYRILRLLSHNITPLFVFDGPHRPSFKRGSKTNTQLTPTLIRLSKKLLKLFGCPFHTAPGEAEAECALLNREGIVDAVLSEDVDTLMFGGMTVIRKWTGEGKSNTPTHVTVYDAESIDSKTGLTQEGMVLVALMRGGDYLPEGVPGCGIKTAVEAAKAGFGKDLYAVRDDEQGLEEWRERLQHEMKSNESGWFKRKNGKAVIPPGFPNKEVLGFYAEPVVSDEETVGKLREAIVWDGDMDVVALREYARDTFEWRGTGGATKFVRTLAPVLLAQRIWDGTDDACKLVSGLHGRRDHSSTDGCIELRISYTPVEVIPINEQLEVEDDEQEAQEQAGVLGDDEVALMGESTVAKDWNPYVAERIWMLEAFLSRNMQSMIDEYDNAKAAKPKPKTKAATTTTTKVAAKITTKRTAIATDGAVQAPMERYLKTSKHTGNVSPKTVVPRERSGSRPITNKLVSQLSKPKPTPAVNDRGARAVPSTNISIRNPPAPTKGSAPASRTASPAKRRELSRPVATPTKPPVSSRTLSASPTKAPIPSRTAISSSHKAPALRTAPYSPIKRPLPARVGAAAIEAQRATAPKAVRQTLASPRKIKTRARDNSPPPPPQETIAPPRRTTQMTEEPRDESPQRGRRLRSPVRADSPIEGLTNALETVDLTSSSPSRPSTPLYRLPLETIEHRSPTEALVNWMEGVRLAAEYRDPSPVRLRIVRPTPLQIPPSPGLPKVASGTVAALIRNLETISVESPVPETPVRPTAGRSLDDQGAMQDSPNVTVRRPSRKPRPRNDEQDGGSSTPSLECSGSDTLTAHSGNVFPKDELEAGPTMVRVALKGWDQGVWQEVKEGEKAVLGSTVWDSVEVVDLTGI